MFQGYYYIIKMLLYSSFTFIEPWMAFTCKNKDRLNDITSKLSTQYASDTPR